MYESPRKLATTPACLFAILFVTQTVAQQPLAFEVPATPLRPIHPGQPFYGYPGPCR